MQLLDTTFSVVVNEEEGAIVRIRFVPGTVITTPTTLLEKTAYDQLQEYFLGLRKDFDFPIRMKGTSFQIAVWNTLRTVEYGRKISYRELGVLAGFPKAYRAVGTAMNKNCLPIVIPCHRVILSNGSIGLFGSDEEIKIRLLLHEQSMLI